MSKALERRNSFGTTTPKNFTSAVDSVIKDEKKVPHYLRASSGSCHDLCKHGYKSPFEEKQKLSSGRRKKLPTHLNKLTLHGSVILDRPKDVRNRNLSLATSSVSLDEANRIAPKVTPANLKGVASSKQLVPGTAISADRENVKSDVRKKHLMVAQKSGPPKFDQKTVMPVKGLKSSDKILPEKSRTVEKPTTAKQSSFKRPDTLPTKLNLIKQASVPSQASSHMVPSKDRNTLKAKRTSTPPTITGKRASNNGKTGSTLAKPSNANIKKKEGLDKCKTLLSMESELTASVETHEDDVQGLCITCHNMESTLAELSSDAAEYAYKSQPAPEETSISISGDSLDIGRRTHSVEAELIASVETQDDLQVSYVTCDNMESTLGELSSDVKEDIDKSRPAPEETSRSILEDNGVDINEKSEESAVMFPVRSIIAPELQQLVDDQELKAVPSKCNPGHMQTNQNVIDSRSSTNEDIQTDEAARCQLSELLTAVGNADAYDSVLTESSSETEADGVKIDANVDSVINEGREEVGAHEDLQGSIELLAPEEKHPENPKSCLDCASGIVAENIKVDEKVMKKSNISHCQSISETSSEGELLEEPKSELIEPIDSDVQTDGLASVNNDVTFEQDEQKSRIVVQQLPEELSDVEFYEEYDFELSDSDESGAEDEGAALTKNSDDSSKVDGQRPRRVSAPHPDDSSATPYKLKFKRGKIVELTPDGNAPTRLKFRRRAANIVVNGEAQSARKTYKRNRTQNVVATSPDVDSPGVKLRHQDAQEKKDAQGLFNNVIEETASKLVESRKSKVKALVGAFETVISLQDGTPTSSTLQAGNSPYLVHNNEEKPIEEA